MSNLTRVQWMLHAASLIFAALGLAIVTALPTAGVGFASLAVVTTVLALIPRSE